MDGKQAVACAMSEVGSRNFTQFGKAHHTITFHRIQSHMFVFRNANDAHSKCVMSIKFYLHVSVSSGDLIFAIGFQHEIMPGALEFQNGLRCRSLPGRPYIRMNDGTEAVAHLITCRTRLRGVCMAPIFDNRLWQEWHSAKVRGKRKRNHPPVPAPTKMAGEIRPNIKGRQCGRVIVVRAGYCILLEYMLQAEAIVQLQIPHPDCNGMDQMFDDERNSAIDGDSDSSEGD